MLHYIDVIGYANILWMMILLTTLACSTSSSQQYWRPLATPTTRDLNRLYFLDSLRGWVVGDSGTILYTSNGGQNWLQQYPNLNSKIIDIYMLNERLGWALSPVLSTDTASFSGTYLLRTTNGGNVWNYTTFRDKFFQSIFFIDSLNGWMGGHYGILMGTSNGGVSWFDATIDTAQFPIFPIRTIKFFSPHFGFAVGGIREWAGVIWRTTNGGQNWNQYSTGEELYDLHFIDSSRIICVGGGFDDGAGVAHSTNGGTVWQFAYVGIWGQARAVSFRTPSEGWAPLGGSGEVMFSSDTGRTWSSIYTPDSSGVYDVAFTDSNTGYMVGLSGVVLKYSRFQTMTITMNKGWNLLSLPLTVPNPQKRVVFPTATSDAFVYKEGYAVVESLQNGQGFWLKFDNKQTVNIEGLPLSADTIHLQPRWNLIGAISIPVPVTAITQIPENILTSPFYCFDSGYHPVDTLYPGRGYWVKALSSAQLILHDDHLKYIIGSDTSK